MTNVLMAGSVAAAFAAGMVAFFAPCCAGVMMPAYLAAIGGGHRFRVARLTAVYVAGVSLVVLPITLGAAVISSYVNDWHPQMFTIGGLMMIGVAVALWRGSMLPISLAQPRLTGSTLSVFGLGVFSGGATACCAPVLAGAIALSATSGTILGGLVLGVAYVAGMMAPLIPLALIYGHTKNRVRDPKITVRLGAYAKRIGVVRLVGAVLFAAFGLLFVALALTGNSNTAPGFQKQLGIWTREVGSYVDNVPNFVAVPVLFAVLAAFAYAVVRRRGEQREPEEGQGGPARSEAAGQLDGRHPGDRVPEAAVGLDRRRRDRRRDRGQLRRPEAARE